MESRIVGQTVPLVELKLRAGETVYTQSGGLMYQTEGIKMSTNAKGGVMRSLGRMFTGESIFMAHYTAEKDGAIVRLLKKYTKITVNYIGSLFVLI